MAMDLHKFRVDDDLWEAAGVRAAAEGVTLSALIRQWLDDYANGGDANADRAKVRLTVSEKEAVRRLVEYWLPDPGLLLDSVIDAVNLER